MNLNLSSKRELLNLLDQLLVPRAFIRVKDDWYCDNIKCVSVIGLGKSLYGGQFSISIAFLLKELSPSLLPYPSFHLCHFRQAGQFIVPNPEGLKEALNLESSIPTTDRICVITAAIIQCVVPTILRLNSKQVIANEIKTNEDFEPYSSLELKLLLEREGYLSIEDLKLDF
jgi:hypothetical protein